MVEKKISFEMAAIIRCWTFIALLSGLLIYISFFFKKFQFGNFAKKLLMNHFDIVFRHVNSQIRMYSANFQVLEKMLLE